MTPPTHGINSATDQKVERLDLTHRLPPNISLGVYEVVCTLGTASGLDEAITSRQPSCRSSAANRGNGAGLAGQPMEKPLRPRQSNDCSVGLVHRPFWVAVPATGSAVVRLMSLAPGAFRVLTCDPPVWSTGMSRT